MVIIKKYKVKKHSLTNFRKDWNKFPEIFRGTTLPTRHRPTKFQQNQATDGTVIDDPTNVPGPFYTGPPVKQQFLEVSRPDTKYMDRTKIIGGFRFRTGYSVSK